MAKTGVLLLSPRELTRKNRRYTKVLVLDETTVHLTLISEAAVTLFCELTPVHYFSYAYSSPIN